eukprot:142662-Prorocentrum_lima.AAC.1
MALHLRITNPRSAVLNIPERCMQWYETTVAESQEKFIECSRIVAAGNQAMMPEPTSGTPRSQD